MANELKTRACAEFCNYTDTDTHTHTYVPAIAAAGGGHASVTAGDL